MTVNNKMRIPAILSFVLTCIMVFFTKIPTMAVMGMNALFVLYIYNETRKYYNTDESLFLCTIILVPTSTISVIGNSYSNFPLSWFHLLSIVLFFSIICKSRVKKTYIILFVLIAGYLILISINAANNAANIFDSMKQFLTIMLFLTSFIIGSNMAYNSSNNMIDTAIDLYLLATLSFGVQIFIQRAYISFSHSIIGHYVLMGQGRYAYAGLMGDYSFATLYLASGCLLVLIQYFELNKVSFARFIVEEILLFSAIITVSSRTGLVAFSVMAIFYILYNFRRLGSKFFIIIIGGVVAVPIIINQLLISRAGQSLSDSSGRLDNYKIALEYFGENPIVGVGLGLNNLTSNYHIAVPHNFFIQYLLQIGLIGVLILILFYIEFLRRDLVWNSCMKWVFGLIVVGSMFIPDVFSSRFYYVIIIMSMMPPSIRGNKNGKEKSREIINKNE